MKKVACLIVILFLFGCGSPEKKPEMVKVEFRLAEIVSGEGLTEMGIAGSDEKFYLHDEVLISNADIAFALVTTWEGRLAVDLMFTETGKEKVAQLTKDNVGKRMGMLVDGKLVTAPLIKGPILDGKAIINGNFSEEEANRIATGIMLK